MVRIGDQVEIKTSQWRYDYLVIKVVPEGLYIEPRERFGETSLLIQRPEGWKVFKLEEEHTVKISPVDLKTQKDYHESIIKPGKDKLRSPFGGMTREQFEASSLVCLIHITYDIESIVDAWKLDHRLSVSRAGIPVHPGLAGAYFGEESSIEESAYKQRQFPGIYTTPTSQLDLLNKDYGIYPIRPGYVTLILSLSLLEQRNWHLNSRDNYGSIDNLTFTPETLPTLLPKLKQLWGLHESKSGDLWDPEIVFHDAISLDFVEAILVDNEIMRRGIESMVEGKIPVLVRSKDLYKELASRRFFRGEDQLSSSPPQYCYTGILGDWAEEDGPHASDAVTFHADNPYTLMNLNRQVSPKQLEEENAYIWQKRLNLCGIPERYSPEKEELLFRMVEDQIQKIYFEDGPRIPVSPEDYPPWRYTPESYRKYFSHMG